ncbi:MAG: hypothetical protein JHC33_13615 [Ignisphaera sp.]|nr:hypothetical protein [Ignisphaera sp.]
MNIVLNDEDMRFIGHTIYVDTETLDLYGPVRLVQIYCPTLNAENVYVFDSYEFPLVLTKKRILEAQHTVWHNGKYDFDCLDIVPTSWDDTFILDTLINFRSDKHSLDEVATRVYGYNPYGEIDKKAMQKSDWTKELTDEQLRYAATDVWILPTILASFSIEEAGWLYTLDKRTVECFAKMGQKLPIDIEGLEARKVTNEAKIAEINLPINCNSYVQVRPYIGSDSSGDDELALLCSQGNTKACEVRTVRSLKKQISFINKFLAERRGSYIYGHLNIGTVSGRSKCANMNLQQIPQAFKGYIKSEKFLVYADFAQLELRSLCALIGETVLEGLFREKGSDLHSYVRDSLFGAEQTISDAGRGNSLRQIAKIYNFASLYGAGHNTIGNVLLKYTGMNLPEAELKKHKAKWLDTFPMIRAWHNKNVRLWQKKTVLKTTMGRKYIAKLPTDANNIMNSGTAAEIAKLALVYMDKEMDLSKMLMFVHDSYTAEYDTMEEAVEHAEIMARLMNKAWYDVTANCVIKDIPMPVNAYIGTNWGDIDKYPLAEYVYDGGQGEWVK